MKIAKPHRGVIASLSFLGLLLSAQAQTSWSPSDRESAARSAYARGDNAKAIAALNESVRLNPFDPVALNNLAVNYAAQGDYQNAVTLLERAQRLAPNRADIVNNLANLKAWMAQDAQFALGSRAAPQALNFPRAEDTPPDVPPLWGGPTPLPTPGVATQMRVAPPATAPYPQGNYNPAGSTAPYPPAYGSANIPMQGNMSAPLATPYPTAPAQTQVTQPSPGYGRSSSVITERADYASRVTGSTAKPAMITERANDALPRTKKKKRPVPLDCPVP